MRRRLGVCAFAIGAAIACPGAAPAGETPANASLAADCAQTFAASVEVNVYSGMPNPRFALGAEDAKALWELLQRPRSPVLAYRGPPDLGFRGYDVTFRCPAPVDVTVWGEIVFTSDGPRHDPELAMHRIIAARYPMQAPRLIRPDLPGAP